MSTITTKDGVTIFYKDWGPKNAQPIVFHHGWPLSADDWDTQMLYFLGKGYRVVAHDRRGHGRSSQVSDGHDMDHYAADAAAVFEPIVLGESVDVHPLVVLIGVIGGGLMFGLVGLLLALPTITLVKTLVSSSVQQLRAYELI